MHTCKEMEIFMKNILNEGKKTIVDIRKELLTLEEYKNKARDAAAKESKCEKALRQKECEVEDEISSTTRKRRNDVENTYKDQINKSKSQLKKVSTRREKSKDAKVQERIKEETAQLISDNRLIKADIKSLMYKEKIPAICKTDFYYSLLRPDNITDILVILLTLIVLLAALPFAVMAVTPWSESIVLKVILYIVIIIVFGGAYIIVRNTLNSWHDKALTEIGQKKDAIKFNKRKIRKIIKSIRKEKDDSIYNLDKYDEEMASINNDLDALIKERKEALETFENSTRFIIESEISERHKKKLEELRQDYRESKSDADRLEDVANKMTLDISKKYDAYLGKDFLKVDKLDALIEIIDKGEAKTIAEAIEVYKSRYAI